MKTPVPIERDRLGKDAVAGLVLGVESVPDGLAAGLLAGVSPLAGLYAYLFGTIGGSLFTSSAYMAVQATGAMAIVIADVPAVHSAGDPARALFTLSVLTGVLMLAAGFLRLGSVLRFVSNAVMTGFISAVGVNIILGQLANLTGYKAEGANRVIRAVSTVLHPHELHLQSLAVGLVTIALILLLERTSLGPLGHIAEQGRGCPVAAGPGDRQCGDGGGDPRLRRLAGRIAMPALAGLLILVGYRTIKPDDLASVRRTGPVTLEMLSSGHCPARYRVVAPGLQPTAPIRASVVVHVILP